MKAKSHYSTITDPYRAGIELAEQIADIKPEALFIFPTIHYRGSPELVEAIYDVMENDELILIGLTGDGFYEQHKVANAGVSALGINSSNKIKWNIHYETGLDAKPFQTAKNCLSKLNREGNPQLYFVVSDFRTDATKMVSALQKYSKAPLVGGLAGDDDSFQSCFVYANRNVLTNSLAILAMEGDFGYNINLAHKMQPIGNPGKITKSKLTTIQTIDNLPAMDYIEREMGKPIEVVDQGIITLKITNKPNDTAHRILSVLLPEKNINDLSIKLFGGVDNGDYAQVCLAPPDIIIKDVKNITSSIGSLSFNPVAALEISCAGRKKRLAGNIENEVTDILQSCPTLNGLAGFPSFGEIGSINLEKGYSPPMFHNMTFILLLLGDAGN
ncbi:MAG: hypothetical protein APR63_12730 [Desulfuromonas sp. SDB]|nr:MAG: hypothetical protein APR63_12730 [Desulfuromonas sp. SDB]